VWLAIKQRCYYKKSIQYKDWGGRGITVCDEWKNSAKTFIEWAKPLWKKSLQIDRKDNDGDYTPRNCRFVTRKKNCDNRRMRSDNKSGYRGAHHNKRDKKWVVQISINGKNKHLGYFDTPEEAALAYDRAVPDNRPKNFG
jgi:hypothetical protein